MERQSFLKLSVIPDYHCCSLCHCMYPVFYKQDIGAGASQMESCATFIIEKEGMSPFEPLDLGDHALWVLLYAAYGSSFDMDLMLCHLEPLKEIMKAAPALNQIVICDACIEQMSFNKECIVLQSDAGGEKMNALVGQYYRALPSSAARLEVQEKLQKEWIRYQKKLGSLWRASVRVPR